MNKRNIIIFSGIVLIFAGLGGTWLMHEQKTLSQEQTTFKKEKQEFDVQQKDQEKVINEYQATIQQLEKEKATLQKENEVLKNNDSTRKGNMRQFDKIVNEAFHALFDWDPNTYAERKEACKPYLSDQLMALYFNEESSYGDSNGVSSELEKCTLYTKSVQGRNLQGLVVVQYKNKMNQSSWGKAMNVFQITYDVSSQKITDIQNLGSSFNGSLLE